MRLKDHPPRDVPGGRADRASTAPLGPGARRSRYLLILAALMGGVLLAGSAGGWLLYLSVRDAMDRQLEERMLSIATTAAQALGADRFLELLQAPPGSSARERTRFELSRTAEANDLDDISLVDSGSRIVLSLRSDVREGARDPVLQLSRELQTTLVSGEPRATRLMRVEGLAGEYLKTGFAAVVDSTGEILGAVAVEGGSGFFSVLPGMRKKVLTFAGVGVIAVLVVWFFMLRLLRALMRTEESLRRAAALAAIGQISAVVAHEIKNPLAIIRSRSERVRAKILAGRRPEEVLEWFEAIPAEVDRLDTILTNYLSLARPDPGGEERAHVAQAIEETQRLFAPEMAKKNISLQWDPRAAEEAQVAMNPRSLKQILLNLILNAEQAVLARAEEAGAAAGSASATASAEGSGGVIRIAAETARPWVALTVEDDGVGMTEEQRRRALEPFYTTRPTGSGLGLTLVQSLVAARGGSLELFSSPGRGSRIVVRLPEYDSGGERKGER